VTAVDAPPGLGLGGRPTGEFAARPGPRRLAQAAFRVVALAAVLTVLLARRTHDAVSLVLAVTCVAMASVGLAVRRARVAVDADGVRWGWSWAGVRMDRRRLQRADVFGDGVALVSRRGSWFLAARDWDRFDALVRALGRAGLPVQELGTRAPFGSRLQSYGVVLDALMILAMIGAMVVLVIAAT